VSLALLWAPAALAGGGSSVSGYGGVAGSVQSKVTKGDATAAVKAKGSLPFTGFQLGLAFAGGLVLVGLGGTLRRVTRQKN